MVNFQDLYRNRYVRWSSYFILLILFTLLMDQLIMPWYVRLGDEIELPDVVELSLYDAQNKLEQNGFNVIISDSVYDANFPLGTVVEQMPLAYTTVKSGRHVYLKVSIGEKPVIMPNLFYKSPRDAELILMSMGIVLGNIEYEYSDISLEGVVISQSYPAGQNVQKDARIDITISLGPFPKQPTVPNLINKSLDAAQKQLNKLGLNIVSIEYEERDDILPETILGQSLEKGVLIEEDTEIVLVVSKLKNSEEN